MVFIDPIVAMVKKARLDSNLTCLLPASHIHEGFMPDIPDVKGIYVHSGRSPLRQIISSGNQASHVMTGAGRWKVDSLSSESPSDATLLARRFCEVIMPSIPTAGLYTINYEERDTNWDKGFLCYRSSFNIICPYREWITV